MMITPWDLSRGEAVGLGFLIYVLGWVFFESVWRLLSLWTGRQVREANETLEASGRERNEVRTEDYPRLGTNRYSGLIERALFAAVFAFFPSAVALTIVGFNAAKLAIGWSESMAIDPGLRMRGIVGIWGAVISAVFGVASGYFFHEAVLDWLNNSGKSIPLGRTVGQIHQTLVGP